MGREFFVLYASKSVFTKGWQPNQRVDPWANKNAGYMICRSLPIGVTHRAKHCGKQAFWQALLKGSRADRKSLSQRNLSEIGQVYISAEEAPNLLPC